MESHSTEAFRNNLKIFTVPKTKIANYDLVLLERHANKILLAGYLSGQFILAYF